MIGPGKYDEWATAVLKETHAQGVILIVKSGIFGDGFSAQLSPLDVLKIPAVLRDVADMIEADFKENMGQPPPNI